MKKLLICLAALAGLATAEDFPPILVPAGMWPVCGKVTVALPQLCPAYAPGTEPYMLLVRGTSPNTTEYVYTITATRANGEPVTVSGYLARTDTPNGQPSIAVLALGLIHDVSISVVEVVAINTQTARQN